MGSYLLYSSTMSCSLTGIWMSSRSGTLRTTPRRSFGSISSHRGSWPRPALPLSSTPGAIFEGAPSCTPSPTFSSMPGTGAFPPFTENWPGPTALRWEPQAMHHVVQRKLKEAQKAFAGHALLALGPLEILAELRLQHAVDPLGLLLLAQLDAVWRQLAAVEAVLPRWIVAA